MPASLLGVFWTLLPHAVLMASSRGSHNEVHLPLLQLHLPACTRGQERCCSSTQWWFRLKASATLQTTLLLHAHRLDCTVRTGVLLDSLLSMTCSDQQQV